MKTRSDSRARPRAVLAADGALVTAGALALAAGLVVALATLLDASAAGAGVLTLVVVTCGPLAAWRLHARPVDGSSTAGAVLGDMAGFASLWIVLPVAGGLGHGLAALATLAGGSLTWGEGAGVVGVAAGASFLVVAAWLDVAAVRDLLRERAHVWLDVARLGATATYAAYVAGVVLRVTLAPGPPQDQGNAGMMTVLLLVMPPVFGAAAVLGADLLVGREHRRPRGRLMSGV